MSYLGSSATPIPVAFSGVRTQSLSGTGLVSLFTLTRQVQAVTDIEVVVNNVQQSPFDGSYSIVNNGLGLQFSENPSAGTNNIYVVYRDQPLGSLYDQGAVRKTGDTMTGELKLGGDAFGQPIRKLTVREDATDSTFKGIKVVNAGGAGAVAGVAFQGYDWVQGGIWHGRNAGGRSGALVLGTNPDTVDLSEGGLVGRVFVDNAGRVTTPYQPSFRVGVNGSPTAVHGVTFLWDLISHNIGNHYAPATGRFTAPVSGRYFVSFGIRFNNNGSAYTQATLAINGVNAPSGLYANCTQTGATYSTPSWSGVINLTAGDYLTVSGAWSGGTGVYSGAESWFAAHLLS